FFFLITRGLGCGLFFFFGFLVDKPQQLVYNFFFFIMGVFVVIFNFVVVCVFSKAATPKKKTPGGVSRIRVVNFESPQARWGRALGGGVYSSFSDSSRRYW
ncbi:hypothetical protein, partial [Enterobacter hormaechei]